MRPVDKGSAPREYANYQDAGPDLQQRLGDYCSYCERQIETNLAVEHVQPKSLLPALSLLWSNFLLACVNCNSCKGRTPITISDYFWPDTDNTLRALEYSRGGLIRPHPALSAAQQQIARATISLVGLDKDPGNAGREPNPSDKRWFRRQEIWLLAEKDRERLNINNTTIVRELIVENALGRGMFSIWWTVFAEDVDMRHRLRDAFLGTHGGCFDVNEEPLPRTGGQL